MSGTVAVSMNRCDEMDAVLGDYCVDVFEWRNAEEGDVTAS